MSTMDFSFFNTNNDIDAKSQEHPILWYKNKKFSKFWSTYTNLMYSKHQDAISRSEEVSSYTAATFSQMVNQFHPEPQLLQSRMDKKLKKIRKKRKCKMKGLFVLSDDDTLQVSRLAANMHLNDTQDEIDEEYLAFMEQTLKHRLKWNKIKELKKNENQTADSNSAVSEEQNLYPNDFEEHPDDIRTREMQSMYGASATQIHAMETAMQLTFDRISTLHNPTLWPNIPLKLNF